MIDMSTSAELAPAARDNLEKALAAMERDAEDIRNNLASQRRKLVETEHHIAEIHRLLSGQMPLPLDDTR